MNDICEWRKTHIFPNYYSVSGLDEDISIILEELPHVTSARKKGMQEPVLDKIRAEIEQIEINGYIRDVECFKAGINVALNVIDKYKAESEDSK